MRGRDRSAGVVSETRAAASVLGRVPWGRDGLPDIVEAEQWTSSLEHGPLPRRRAPVRLRALPDGTALAARSADGRHVIAQLGRGEPEIRQVPARGPLADALVIDGSIVLLEHGGALRRVMADGAEAWETATDGVRLLAPADGAVLLAIGGEQPAVARVDPDDGSVAERSIASCRGGEPFVAGTGLAFASYDAQRDRRQWVLWDREGEQLIDGADSAWGLLGAPIGADATGRAYGYVALELGRVARDGEVDWRLPLDGATVDDAGSVTLAGPALDGTLAVWTPDSLTRLRVPEGGARLVSRRADGSLLVHAGDAGRLLTYAPDGTLEHDEPAVDDAWLAYGDVQAPDRDSVTFRGEVIIGLRSPAGLTVIALTAL
jgi:hypothetical protein